MKEKIDLGVKVILTERGAAEVSRASFVDVLRYQALLVLVNRLRSKKTAGEAAWYLVDAVGLEIFPLLDRHSQVSVVGISRNPLEIRG